MEVVNVPILSQNGLALKIFYNPKFDIFSSRAIKPSSATHAATQNESVKLGNLYQARIVWCFFW